MGIANSVEDIGCGFDSDDGAVVVEGGEVEGA